MFRLPVLGNSKPPVEPSSDGRVVNIQPSSLPEKVFSGTRGCCPSASSTSDCKVAARTPRSSRQAVIAAIPFNKENIEDSPARLTPRLAESLKLAEMLVAKMGKNWS